MTLTMLLQQSEIHAIGFKPKLHGLLSLLGILDDRDHQGTLLLLMFLATIPLMLDYLYDRRCFFLQLVNYRFDLEDLLQ
jgi:hypothetical protein